MGLLLLAVGFGQSWSLCLLIINMCLISSIMTLGINIQWGYGGIFNVGIMGFTALGGLTAVLISHYSVPEAVAAGGKNILISFLVLISVIILIYFVNNNLQKKILKYAAITAILIIGFYVINLFYRPAVLAIEKIDTAHTGFLGGLGLPITFSWIVGGFVAAGVAFIIGKITLGLRADYLAIATLGISEIIIVMLKQEDWLSRGVRNVTGLDRPVPYEIDLQESEWFVSLIEKINFFKLSNIIDKIEYQKQLSELVIKGSSIYVKLCYTGLFVMVLLIIFFLCERALNSPWGRMMRAIRDNEVSANAMGKNVIKRHLQVFVLGSAVVGIAGAMLTTLNGQFTPGSYVPLRYTFLIWVMVIIGGSGNNLGSVLGGFIVWFIWIESGPVAKYIIEFATFGIGETSSIKIHLLNSIPYFRYFVMGLLMLLILRYMPKGILPEKKINN